MNPQYNRILALLRLFGVIVIFMGLLGLAFMGTFLIAFYSGVPDWFSKSLAPEIIRSAVSVPIWIVGGICLLLFSRRLTRFIVKHYADEKGEVNTEIQSGL